MLITSALSLQQLVAVSGNLLSLRLRFKSGERKGSNHKDPPSESSSGTEQMPGAATSVEGAVRQQAVAAHLRLKTLVRLLFALLDELRAVDNVRQLLLTSHRVSHRRGFAGSTLLRHTARY